MPGNSSSVQKSFQSQQHNINGKVHIEKLNDDKGFDETIYFFRHLDKKYAWYYIKLVYLRSDTYKIVIWYLIFALLDCHACCLISEFSYRKYCWLPLFPFNWYSGSPLHLSRPPEELYENDSYDFSDDESGNLKPRRQHWSSKMQFVLACIGYSVGLANVWRFPYIM